MLHRIKWGSLFYNRIKERESGRTTDIINTLHLCQSPVSAIWHREQSVEARLKNVNYLVQLVNMPFCAPHLFLDFCTPSLTLTWDTIVACVGRSGSCTFVATTWTGGSVFVTNQQHQRGLRQSFDLLSRNTLLSNIYLVNAHLFMRMLLPLVFCHYIPATCHVPTCTEEYHTMRLGVLDVPHLCRNSHLPNTPDPSPCQPLDCERTWSVLIVSPLHLVEGTSPSSENPVLQMSKMAESLHKNNRSESMLGKYFRKSF